LRLIAHFIHAENAKSHFFTSSDVAITFSKKLIGETIGGGYQPPFAFQEPSKD
jgi:hypothetical protein